jgi:hypothetical protein
MADNCKYKIKGVEGEFTENELKAYLLKGGKAEYEKIKPQVSISDANKNNLDKLVEGITNGTTNKTKVNAYINSLKLADETKNKFIDYIAEQLREKKKGTYEGLTNQEKGFYDFYESKFLNGEMPYDAIMHQLGSIADRQPTQELRDKYNAIRNIFYAEHQKRAAKQEKIEEVKENKSFDEDINSNRLGLSNDELTNFRSDERILRDSNVDFISDNSFLEDNDQLRAAFIFDQYAQDLDSLIGKFQVQYGNDYLKKMSDFVKNGDNQLDARVSVSVALNNHLKYLQDRTDNPLEKLKYRSMEESNAADSQDLGRRGSLLLNSLRAWNKDLLSDLAWVGVVDPNLKSRADLIKETLGSEITDEDLVSDENGQLNIFEEEETPAEETPSTKKEAGFFKKRAAKIAAKYLQVKSEEQLKEEIEKQKKNCK